MSAAYLVPQLPSEPLPVIRVEFPLNTIVLAQNLGDLISSVDELYYTILWLDRAAEYSYGHFPDNDFGPNGLSFEEHLWIDELSIGTPNKARLRGRKKPLATIAVVAATFWGGITAGTEFAKTAAEIWKLKSEAQIEFQLKDKEIRLKELEITEKEIDILEKTKQLYQDGKISESAYKYKLERLPEVMARLQRSVAVLDPDRKIIIDTPK